MTDELQPPPLAPAAQPGGHGPEALRFGQTGSSLGIAPIVLLNALLNIITLTLYRFWARTRVRRYLWSTTTINDDALEYTGTGWEMFRAFLIVIVFLFVPFFAIYGGFYFLTLQGSMWAAPLGFAFFIFYLGLFYLFFMAIWLARRYRLSRTYWRGVRFGMDGSASGYAWASIGYGLLTIITLGFYGPAAEMRLFRRLWNETYFGSTKFAVSHPNKGLAGPIYGPYLLMYLGGIIGFAAFIAILTPQFMTLAQEGGEPGAAFFVAYLVGYLVFLASILVFGVFYFAALWRRMASLVEIEDVRFSLRADALSIGWLILGNLLIVVFTLGFGLPWAQLRVVRYIFSRLAADGTLDVAAIAQSTVPAPKSGEGLADAFDLGTI